MLQLLCAYPPDYFICLFACLFVGLLFICLFIIFHLVIPVSLPSSDLPRERVFLCLRKLLVSFSAVPAHVLVASIPSRVLR